MSAFSIGATLLDAMVLAILSQADTYGYQITKDIQAHFAVSESTCIRYCGGCKKRRSHHL